MNLGQYIIYRLIGLVVQLFGALALVFTMLKIIPYDPTVFFLINYRSSDPADRQRQLQALRESLGLDKTIYQQYFDFIYNLIAHQSMGTSWGTGEPVLETLTRALPNTFITFGIAFLIYTPLAVIFGIRAARYRGKIFDTIIRVSTTATYAIPSYILGLWVVIYASQYNLAPWPRPLPDSLLGLLRLSLLPVFVVVLASTGFQFRLIRANMLEILRSDYIRTAKAKGLGERAIIYKHALRNALPFIITTVAVTFPVSFSGIAALEVVFAIPGIGRVMVGAANGFDWPILIGATAVFTLLNAIILGVTDVLIQLVDPKLRFNQRFSFDH